MDSGRLLPKIVHRHVRTNSTTFSIFFHLVCIVVASEPPRKTKTKKKCSAKFINVNIFGGLFSFLLMLCSIFFVNLTHKSAFFREKNIAQPCSISQLGIVKLCPRFSYFYARAYKKTPALESRLFFITSKNHNLRLYLASLILCFFHGLFFCIWLRYFIFFTAEPIRK